MPATLYLRPQPRAFFLITQTHALIFRQPDASESKASRSVVVAEFLPVDEVDMRGLVRASKGQTVEGVLGVTSVPTERSPIPEIFLLLVSHSTPLSPLLPSSSLRPSRVVAVEFHSLSSSFWDHPDLSIASHSTYNSYDDEDDDYSGPYGSSSAGPSGSAPGSGASTIQSEAQKQGIDNPCNGMRKYLESGGFFYADECKWDISRRMGESNWVQAERHGLSSSTHPLETFDERFVWNKSLLAPFLSFRSGLPNETKAQLDQQSLLIPVIQGFCGSLPISTGGWTEEGKPEVAALGLISRQSWKRAGARFRTRGIDDDGQVANFVETELILANESVCMSYVQVRGSVPLFWQQPSAGLQTLQQKVEITRPPQATQPAFDKHFLELLEHYHSVHAVNLLGQKDAESMLSAAYSDHLQSLRRTLDAESSSQGTLDLTPYDFHSAVRAGGHESVRFDFSAGLREVSSSMDRYGWTAVDTGSGEVVELQQGVFRVNCLDCLDRTNYVQDVISSITLSRFLASIGSNLASSPTLWAAHRELWADNGDRLSKIYAGTGALNTSATRSGKKTFAGLLSDATKSVGRAYINNFQDKGKQTSIDMLLGMMAGQRPVILFDPIGDSVQSALRARSNEYSSARNITIFSGTWNLNAKAPDEALDAWLFPPNTTEPDIYMIAFQEIVELTPGQILQTDPAKKRMWEKFIMDTFAMRNGKSDYILFRSEQLVGTALIVIVKSSLTKAMRNVESTTKKTGLSGLSGNKGGVGIRFDLFDSTVCFVTCHLTAGQSNVSERNGDYKTLVAGMRFLRGKMIEDHDIIIWSADFNYRVALPNAEVREALANDDIESLLSADQLLNTMDVGEAFFGYEEGPIRFRPTYKFDNATDTYDTSEKQRIPSWTDRVLFRGDALRLKEYNRAELTTSDHRPVYAVFDATVREVDHIRKDVIGKEILHKILQDGGESVDGKVERVVRNSNGVGGIVKGLTNGKLWVLAHVERDQDDSSTDWIERKADQKVSWAVSGSSSPALRASSPRLPPRPSSAASMKERSHMTPPSTESTRLRSLSNLSSSTSTSAPPSSFTSDSTATATSGARRAAPPIPARPNLGPTTRTVNPDSDRLARVPPPPLSSSSSRPSSSLSTSNGQLTSSLSGLPPLNTSPNITPSSTGEYVLVQPSSSFTSLKGNGRRETNTPPLPPRVMPISNSANGSRPRRPSYDTKNVTTPTAATAHASASPGTAPKVIPRVPPPTMQMRKSLDLNAPPPNGLVSPVSPDVVMPRIGTSSPSPVPASLHQPSPSSKTFASDSSAPAPAPKPAAETPVNQASPAKAKATESRDDALDTSSTRGRSVSELSKLFQGQGSSVSVRSSTLNGGKEGSGPVGAVAAGQGKKVPPGVPSKPATLRSVSGTER